MRTSKILVLALLENNKLLYEGKEGKLSGKNFVELLGTVSKAQPKKINDEGASYGLAKDICKYLMEGRELS